VKWLVGNIEGNHRGQDQATVKEKKEKGPRDGGVVPPRKMGEAKGKKRCRGNVELGKKVRLLKKTG